MIGGILFYCLLIFVSYAIFYTICLLIFKRKNIDNMTFNVWMSHTEYDGAILFGSIMWPFAIIILIIHGIIKLFDKFILNTIKKLIINE